MLYVFEGSITVEGEQVEQSTGAVVPAHQSATVVGGAHGAEVLMLQGRPIGEPVAQYGPFVMNTHAEIEQAFADYRATEFGGWPWDSNDPVHGASSERFARHAGGKVEHPGRERETSGA